MRDFTEWGREAFKVERDSDYEILLSKLLTTIFTDGGKYIKDHGFEKAVEVAQGKVMAMDLKLEEYQEAVKECIAYSNGRYSEWGEGAMECFDIIEAVEP